ncbi:MAG: diguanylate cyclase [Leptospira sp.]|nr:diguanylate cyclase [Leptospira sp.]
MTTKVAKQILVVEDSDIQLRLLDRVLSKNGYTVLCAATAASARLKIANEKIDVVLLDWELPDGNGIDLIKEILASSPTGWIPIIMITSHTESCKIKEAIEAGATDFISKPADQVELLARIFGALRIKALEDLLIETSIRDSLTGLYNRRYIEERIEQEFQRSKRHKHSIAIAVLDIDFFKRVNDKYGHDAGDMVLKFFAKELRLNLRKSDIIARFGGEEFVVILPETSLKFALDVMDKIRKQISNTPIFLENGEEIKITFSGGLSGGVLTELAIPHDYLKEADKNLYLAKESGRNRILGPS